MSRPVFKQIFSMTTEDTDKEIPYQQMLGKMALSDSFIGPPMGEELLSASYGIGCCFTNSSTNKYIFAAQAVMTRTGPVTGHLVAKLYSMTGTYGTDGVPTGSVHITSEPVDIATSISTSWKIVQFRFLGQYILLPATYYCIVIYAQSDVVLGGNTLKVLSNEEGGHDGNSFTGDEGSWSPISGTDIYFRVFGYEYPTTPHDIVNPEDVKTWGVDEKGFDQTYSELTM